MKLKYYLRGFGAGILLTTIVLTISNNIHKGSQSLSKNESSSGAAVFDFTRAETKGENQTTTAAVEKNSQSSSDNSSSTSVPSKEGSTSQSKEDKTTGTVADSQKNITVDLSNVTYTQMAAQMLATAGVIENWEDFNSYLIQKEYSLKVRQGVYHFQKGEDYEAIAKTLVGEN